MHRSLETSLQQDPNSVCKKTQSFFQRTADFCKSKPKLISTFLAGMKTSVDECQWQFRNRRWNCTTSRNSIKGILRYGKLSTKTNKHHFNLCTLLSMDFSCTVAFPISHDLKPRTRNWKPWLWEKEVTKFLQLIELFLLLIVQTTGKLLSSTLSPQPEQPFPSRGHVEWVNLATVAAASPSVK